jgi:hypothetical protein
MLKVYAREMLQLPDTLLCLKLQHHHCMAFPMPLADLPLISEELDITDIEIVLPTSQQSRILRCPVIMSSDCLNLMNKQSFSACLELMQQ